MKKFAVLGAGLMGRVIVKDVVEKEPNAQVTLIDVNEALLNEIYNLFDKNKLKICKLNVNDTTATSSMLQKHDVVISALPHRLSLPAIKAAIKARVSMVDLTGKAPEERLALHEEAENARITIIPGCGVAPGISNICVGRGVELLDETHEAIIYVGGIPKKKEPPLYYQTVFSLESVFDAYLRKARILKQGEIVEVEPMSGVEKLSFPEPIGPLEAFYTDGLASLIVTMKGKISHYLAEKTLRYPGHRDRIKLLGSCGMLGKKPVKINSHEIIPLDFLIKQLSNILKLSPEGDMLIMRIIIKGIKNGIQRTHTFELFDQYDSGNQITAMARTTAFPAVWAARMITDKKINKKGVQFPEQIFSTGLFSEFISAMKNNNILITHSINDTGSKNTSHEN